MKRNQLQMISYDNLTSLQRTIPASRFHLPSHSINAASMQSIWHPVDDDQSTEGRAVKKSISSHIRIRPQIVHVAQRAGSPMRISLLSLDDFFSPIPHPLAPMLHFYVATVENSNNETGDDCGQKKCCQNSFTSLPGMEWMVTPGLVLRQKFGFDAESFLRFSSPNKLSSEEPCQPIRDVGLIFRSVPPQQEQCCQPPIGGGSEIQQTGQEKIATKCATN